MTSVRVIKSLSHTASSPYSGSLLGMWLHTLMILDKSEIRIERARLDEGVCDQSVAGIKQLQRADISHL